MNNTPLLSICIPTYNRAHLISECLDPIISQIETHHLHEKVELIISDNCSTDNTQEVLSSYKQKYSFIRTYKNGENIGADSNVIKSASYANGRYIWFFSDDDVQMPEAIPTVLNIIKQSEPNAILCNMDLYSKDMKNLIDPRLLRVSSDTFLHNKKELFSFLESKFFLPIDWYITCLSNTIVHRSLFEKHVKTVNVPENIFRHSSLIYYNSDDYSVYVVGKALVKFRSDNRSFGPTEKVTFLIYWYQKLNEHNGAIINYNQKYISLKFRFLTFVKTAIRTARLIFLKIFKYDISDVLMKLFYR